MFLNQVEKQRINQAITDVESRTAGELVTVIARASDDYLYIPLLWAATIALLVPGILYYLAVGFGWEQACPDWGWRIPCDFSDLYIFQLGLFMVLALLFRWQLVKMLLVPRSVKQRRGNRHAYVQFYEQGLHETDARNGILIFVSIAEHYVEILADQEISEKIDHSRWQQIVDNFVVYIKSGNVADGFIETINACGDCLAEHFPDQINDANQLSDHLIEID